MWTCWTSPRTWSIRPTWTDWSLPSRPRFGGADILINNAGTGSEEKILEAKDDRWQYYWDLHVMAAVRLARALAPTMIERGGGVVLNNASICATQPLYYEPIYTHDEGGPGDVLQVPCQ